MREHIRINHTHRDRKPYQCGYCDFRAHTSGNCRKHCVSKHKGTLIKLYPRGIKCPSVRENKDSIWPSTTLSSEHRPFLLCLRGLMACFSIYGNWYYLIAIYCTLMRKFQYLSYNFIWSGLEIKWIKVIDKYDDKSPCLWNTSNVPRLSGKYTFVSLIKIIKLFSRNYLLRCETLLSNSGC